MRRWARFALLSTFKVRPVVLTRNLLRTETHTHRQTSFIYKISPFSILPSICTLYRSSVYQIKIHLINWTRFTRWRKNSLCKTCFHFDKKRREKLLHENWFINHQFTLHVKIRERARATGFFLIFSPRELPHLVLVTSPSLNSRSLYVSLKKTAPGNRFSELPDHFRKHFFP